MISFDLVCSNGHKFECWFKEGASFEQQKDARLINCPVCNDDRVEKALSTFAIKKNGKPRQKVAVDLQQAMHMVQDYLEKHFEDVGVAFAKEALKMHYGKSKKRNIRGTATADEETLLKEEGVQFLKIPIVKRLDS